MFNDEIIEIFPGHPPEDMSTSPHIKFFPGFKRPDNVLLSFPEYAQKQMR
jgi:hypothetical protein